MMASAWHRVLAIRTDKVGDMLLTMPAIRAVRRALPRTDITVLASPYNSVVVAGWDAVNSVCTYDRAWPFSRRLETVRQLRVRRFDACLVFSPDLESYVVARLSAAPVRAGLVYSRRVLDRLFSPLLLTASSIEHVDEAVAGGRVVRHLVEQTMDVVVRAGLPAGPGTLEIVRDQEADAWASTILQAVRAPHRPVIALHLSQKWFESGWSARDLRALVQAVATALPGCAIVLTCGIVDRAAADAVASEELPANAAVVDVDFRRWTALFGRCDVIITRDTGAIHVASAVGRPVVVVYARNGFAGNSQQFAPWRVPHRIVRDGPFEEVAPQIVSGAAALVECRPRHVSETGSGLNVTG